MNIEEATENLKKYISFSEKECNFPSIFDWNWHMELANDIETLLTAYEKEKEKNKELVDKIKEEIEAIKTNKLRYFHIAPENWAINILQSLLEKE